MKVYVITENVFHGSSWSSSDEIRAVVLSEEAAYKWCLEQGSGTYDWESYEVWLGPETELWEQKATTLLRDTLHAARKTAERIERLLAEDS